LSARAGLRSSPVEADGIGALIAKGCPVEKTDKKSEEYLLDRSKVGLMRGEQVSVETRGETMAFGTNTKGGAAGRRAPCRGPVRGGTACTYLWIFVTVNRSNGGTPIDQGKVAVDVSSAS